MCFELENKTLALYDTHSWEHKQTLLVPAPSEADVTVSFFFSPDSLHLVTVSGDLLCIFSVNSPNPLSTVKADFGESKKTNELDPTNKQQQPHL